MSCYHITGKVRSRCDDRTLTINKIRNPIKYQEARAKLNRLVLDDVYSKATGTNGLRNINISSAEREYVQKASKQLQDSFKSMIETNKAVSGRKSDFNIQQEIDKGFVEALKSNPSLMSYARMQGNKGYDIRAVLEEIEAGNATIHDPVFVGNQSLLDLLSDDITEVHQRMVNKMSSEYATQGTLGLNTYQFKELTENLLSKADYDRGADNMFRAVVNEMSGTPEPMLSGALVEGVKKWLQSAWLGSTGWASIKDLPTIGANLGYKRLAVEAIRVVPSLFSGTKSQRMTLNRELADMGLVWDEEDALFGGLTRFQFGNESTSLNPTKVSALRNTASSLFNKAPDVAYSLSGNKQITRWQRNIVTSSTIKAIREGDFNALGIRNSGLSTNDLGRIQKELQRAYSSGKAIDAVNWSNNSDLQKFAFAMENIVNHSVYRLQIGDRSVLASNPTASSLLTFMNSAIGSFNRQGSRLAMDSKAWEATVFMATNAIWANLVETAKYDLYTMNDSTPYEKSDIVEMVARSNPMLLPLDIGLSAYNIQQNGNSISTAAPIISFVDQVINKSSRFAEQVSYGEFSEGFNTVRPLLPFMSTPYIKLGMQQLQQ